MQPKSKYLILAFVVLFNITASSQTILEKQISIPDDTYQVDELLSVIEQQSGASFSYNPDILDQNRTLKYKAEDYEVERCLDDIFENDLRYVASGKYIVLLDNSKNKKTAKQKVVVQGKITNDDNKPIANVSVYDIQNNKTAITNDEGEFSITIDSTQDYGLSIGKYGYMDTLIVFNPTVSGSVDIKLQKQDSIALSRRTMDNSTAGMDLLDWMNFFIPKMNRINSSNLSHIDGVMPFQVSVLPGISTNLSKFGVLKNNISLNILIGYSKGVEGMEIAGLMNFDKEDVRWVQLAGLTNMVGGNTYGFQSSGIANIVIGEVNGIQSSGILNFSNTGFQGVQAAGILNIGLADFQGVQAGGVLNFNRGYFDGVQVAGVVNGNLSDLKGTQAAGVVNFVYGDIAGGQIAGVANVSTGNIQGTQISGLLNISNSSTLQISGLLNVAINNKGIQLAPFNICDTSSGASIGLLSIVRKGYNKIIFSANELMYVNLNAHLGTESFYNIFNLGWMPADKVIWGFGYGFGHKFRLTNWFKFDIELIAKNLKYNTVWNNEFFPYGVSNFNLDFRIANKFSVIFGPSLNLYIWDKNKNLEILNFVDSSYNISIMEKYGDKVVTKSWLGFYFGINF